MFTWFLKNAAPRETLFQHSTISDVISNSFNGTRIICFRKDVTRSLDLSLSAGTWQTDRSWAIRLFYSFPKSPKKSRGVTWFSEPMPEKYVIFNIFRKFLPNSFIDSSFIAATKLLAPCVWWITMGMKKMKYKSAWLHLKLNLSPQALVTRKSHAIWWLLTKSDIPSLIHPYAWLSYWGPRRRRQTWW